MLLPKIFIVGVAKCGTTALWYNLDKHPDIHMATPSDTNNRIEMHFWHSQNWNRGLEWYSSRFEEGKIGGDKSPEYHAKINSLKAIKKHVPDALIIMCVRCPIDREYSAFSMHKRAGREKKFNINKRFGKGKYINKIERNLVPIFGKESIYVCVSERLKKDTTNEMKKIFDFIGVEDLALPRKEVSKTLMRNKSRQNKEDIEVNRAEKFYRVWTENKNVMNKSERTKLLPLYKESNEELFDYLGYRVEEWEV